MTKRALLKDSRMKKAASFVFMILLSAAFTYAQLKQGQVPPERIPAPVKHYIEEYTFDRPADPVAWSNQEHGLHAAFGLESQSYLRCEVPTLFKMEKTWCATGWKGERLNTQMVLWSPDSISQVRYKISDLKNNEGLLLSKSNIRVYLIRYVLSNLPCRAEKFNCGIRNDTAWLVPDRLEEVNLFEVPGRTVRPIWITVDIPSTAKPGEYQGTMEVIHLKDTLSFEIKIRVQNQVLPDPHDWNFRLDLWQNPWVIAYYYHLKPWSDEHKSLLRKHLQNYAEAGGKFISTYAIQSPWSDNSYSVEGTMIEIIKDVDGQWKFDYSIFDQYVRLAMEAGIDKAITIFTPLPWDNRYRFFHAESGNYVWEKWPPSNEQYKIFWNSFLNNLKIHLKTNGWLEKTYLGFNENTLENTLAAMRIIKENYRDWRITYSGNWHSELAGLVDDFSCGLNNEPSSNEILKRKNAGFTTTFYVSCAPSRPNNFVFSPASESLFMGWYAAAKGYSGFLRWAYDAWPADPLRDARHVSWPAGDCFLVYPGAASCVRLEKLREGISDYEKIWILKNHATQKSAPEVRKLIGELDRILHEIADEKGYCRGKYKISSLDEILQKGKTIIQNLSDSLAN